MTNAFAQCIPRPEYPRPQFERVAWKNLNEAWTYAYNFDRSLKFNMKKIKTIFSKVPLEF